MPRRRRNDINYARAGCGFLILLYILFLILKKVFIVLKPYLTGIINFITDPNVIGNIAITIVVIGIIIITVVIIYFIIQNLKEKQKKKEEEERKRLAEIKAEEERKIAAIKAEEKRKEEEERRRLAAIEAEKERKIAAIQAKKERLRIEEEERLAAIKEEREKQKAIEKERLRLEREYQYGYRDDMTGFEYEEYCANRFRIFNWKAEVTKKSGDFGVDVIARKKGITIVAQCKKYTKQKVGYDAVKEVFTAKALYGADFAIVITNNDFFKSAVKSAKNLNVQLIRHPDLDDWLIKIFPEDKQLKVKKKNIKTIKDWIKYYNVKFLPYEDVFKMLRGDDYDLCKATFDLWEKTKSNSDEWIFSFINELDDIFSFLDKKAFDVKELNDATEKVNKLLPFEKKDEIQEKEIKDNRMSLEEWTNKYKEKLEPYNEIYKMTEGDDFDLYIASYEAWKESDEPDIKANEWIDMFVNATKKMIKELEEKYGPINEFTDEIINKIIEEEKNKKL